LSLFVDWLSALRVTRGVMGFKFWSIWSFIEEVRRESSFGGKRGVGEGMAAGEVVWLR
jgi:hypothetical protein